MPLIDFVSDLPAEKQEAYRKELGLYMPKTELERYVEIAGLEKHPEFQRQLSIKHETTMSNWQKDKLPGLIDDEIKKRGTKQPWEIEIEKLKAEGAEKDRQITLKERRSQAIAELAKHGIDPELADFVIAEDEAKFGENIKRLVGKVTIYRDEAVKKTKEGIFNQTPPRGGSPIEPADLKAQYAEAEKKGDGVAMLRIKSQMRSVTQ